jgi:hypothetical protein
MDEIRLRPDHRDNALAEAAALADLAANHLALRVVGFDHRAFDPLRSLLKSQFGIDVEHLWGCQEIPKELADACGAYNQVMEAEIARRFGQVVERVVAASRAIDLESGRSLMLAREPEGLDANRKRKIAGIMDAKKSRKR